MNYEGIPFDLPLVPELGTTDPSAQSMYPRREPTCSCFGFTDEVDPSKCSRCRDAAQPCPCHAANRLRASEFQPFRVLHAIEANIRGWDHETLARRLNRDPAALKTKQLAGSLQALRLALAPVLAELDNREWLALAGLTDSP